MVMTMRVVFRSGVSGCLLTVVVGAALLAGCQRPKELRVPLDYRPTDRIEVTGLKVPPTLRLAVTVIDNRPDKSSIGQNSEGSPPVPIYPNEPSPDVFLRDARSEEHTSELQSRSDLVCRLLLEKKKNETSSQSTLA